MNAAKIDKATFTPGPWTLSGNHPWIVQCQTDLHGYKGEIGAFGYRPNAVLISAAPELLAALKAILDGEEAVADVEDYDLDPTPAKRRAAHKKLAAAWKKARKAIAKAEGR